MTIFRSAACAATLLATATMIATPVAAATRTVPITIPLSAKPAQAPTWSPADETFNAHRWRGYRRHRDRIDGGDVLAGILVIGGIAAIASAADKNRDSRADRRDYPRDDRRYDYRSDRRERDYGAGYRGNGRGAMDRAVDACAAEAERGGRVGEIFDVERIDGEWRVRGDYRDGREFSCSVDGNGRAYVGSGDRADNAGWDARGGDDQPVARAPGPDESDDRYAAGQTPDFADPR